MIFAVQVGERGIKRDGAVADILMGLGADVAASQEQPELGTLERWALGRLVTAEQQGPIRRIEVEADNAPDFALNEQRCFSSLQSRLI